MPLAGDPLSSTAVEAKRPFIQVQNNAQLDAQKDQEMKMAAADKAQQTPEKLALLAYLERLWEEAKTYKEETGVHDEMIRNLRQRDGDYEPDIIADIEEIGGTDIFLGITDVKCRAAEAWINDVLNADHDKPWSLSPTPLPELPDELKNGIVKETMDQVIQNVIEGGEPLEIQEIQDFAADMRQDIDDKLYAEAQTRVGRMEVVINDQMVEGNWQNAWDDFVSNLVTLKCGFIKGPVVRRKKKMNWVKVNGRSKPEITLELTVEFDAPNPLDIFESRGMTNVDDGTLIERIRFTRLALQRMKGTEGYDDAAIDLVLHHFGPDGYTNYTETDDTRKKLEEKGWDTKFTPDSIEGLEYWTCVQGAMLIDVGMEKDPDGKAIKPLEEYEINAIRIGPYIIYRAINDDPLGRRSIFKSGWAKVPGSFWFKGVPELMADLQRICNASIRALVNNQSMASGSQMVYSDISRLPAGNDIEESYPGQVHQFTSLGAGNEKPLYTLDIPSHATELMGIYTSFANLADEYTGIPAYEHGQGTHVGGAGRTLGGLSMLMTNAARGIKLVIMRIDKNVLRLAIQRTYEFNMLYHPDETIKGDVEVQPEGILARIIKEQLMQRRIEFLNATNNETDRKIMGLEGRATVLRDAAKSLDSRAGGVVKTPEQIEELEEQEQRQQEQMLQVQMQQILAAGQGAPRTGG